MALKTVRALVELKVVEQHPHAPDEDALVAELEEQFKPDDDLGIVGVEIFRVVSGRDDGE